MYEFSKGDFVAVDLEMRIGTYQGHRGDNWIEVWFGDVCERGLPITYRISPRRCINIRQARSVKLYPSELKLLERSNDVYES